MFDDMHKARLKAKVDVPDNFMSELASVFNEEKSFLQIQTDLVSFTPHQIKDGMAKDHIEIEEKEMRLLNLPTSTKGQFKGRVFLPAEAPILKFALIRQFANVKQDHYLTPDRMLSNDQTEYLFNLAWKNLNPKVMSRVTNVSSTFESKTSLTNFHQSVLKT